MPVSQRVAPRRFLHTLVPAAGLALALIGQPARVLAQQAPKVADLEALSLEQLMTIEVQSVFGASRYLQRITEAPASVSIITAEEINRYGYRTLADALRMVRGFYINSDRQYAFVGVRSFQRPGDYNTHVLLTIDGHRVNDNVYDQAYLDEASLVHLDDVERIEVIRGPSSSLYGSNAFFGVVNVVTRHGRQFGGAEASIDVGSFGRRGARAAWGGGVGGNGALSLSASTSQADGPERLYYPEFDDPATNFGVARDLDFADRRNLRARLDLGGFVLQSGWNQRTKGVPTAAYGIVFNDRRSAIRDTQGYLDVNWERQWSARLTTSVRGGYDEYRYLGVMPFDYGTPDRPEVIENRDESVGRWHGVEARASGVSGRHRWTAGFEVRRNTELTLRNYDVAPRLSYLDDSRQSVTTGWYAQDDMRLSRHLTASAGVRRDTYSGFENPTTPRLALIATPARNRTFKLVYGEAFRAPNVYEVFYAYGPYKSNPRLAPERARTFELAWEEYVGRHYRVGANVFAYRVKNLIGQVLDRADDLLVYDNVEAATAKGLELEAEGKWAGGLQVRASYAWQRARDADTRGRLTNSPEHVGQALFSLPLGVDGGFASLTFRSVSARTAKDGTRVPGYAVPGICLVSPISRRLSLQVVVDNLLNTPYSDPAAEELRQVSVRQDGRTACLRLSWRLQ